MNDSRYLRGGCIQGIEPNGKNATEEVYLLTFIEELFDDFSGFFEYLVE